MQTDIEFLESLKRMSLSREFTKDDQYVIRRCCGINQKLRTLISNFNTPENMFRLAREIEATPEHQQITQMCGESGYDMECLVANLCAVCEDVIVGRIPLPTDLAAAIKSEFVENIRAMIPV